MAEPNNQIWRLVLGLILIAVIWLLPVIGSAVVFSLTAGPEALAGMDSMTEAATPVATLVFVGGFIFAYPALWLVLRLLHGRKISSLLGPTAALDWRGFQIAMLVILAYAMAGFVISVAAGSTLPNLEFSRWWVLLPIAIPLVFLQTSAEELIFRGYLIQQLGSRFASAWIWWVLPAAIFASLHWNPAVFLENAPLVVLATFVMGLVAGDVTARTGNLGASIGLHFANNAYAILIQALPGPLSGLALYIADVDMADTVAVRAGLIFQIATILGLYFVYIAIVSRRRT